MLAVETPINPGSDEGDGFSCTGFPPPLFAYLVKAHTFSRLAATIYFPRGGRIAPLRAPVAPHQTYARWGLGAATELDNRIPVQRLQSQQQQSLHKNYEQLLRVIPLGSTCSPEHHSC